MKEQTPCFFLVANIPGGALKSQRISTWGGSAPIHSPRNTAPGFMIPTGSSAALIARIADSFTGSP